MILARITGSVVSTIHHSIVDGKKLLIAERLDGRRWKTIGRLSDRYGCYRCWNG
jgi:microcompartment protein CcmK/EutM